MPLRLRAELSVSRLASFTITILFISRQLRAVPDSPPIVTTPRISHIRRFMPPDTYHASYHYATDVIIFSIISYQRSRYFELQLHAQLHFSQHQVLCHLQQHLSGFHASFPPKCRAHSAWHRLTGQALMRLWYNFAELLRIITIGWRRLISAWADTRQPRFDELNIWVSRDTLNFAHGHFIIWVYCRASFS